MLLGHFQDMINSNVTTVQVQVEFGRIGEIDTMNEKYQAEVVIESKWLTKETFTNYDPNVHWNPKIFIENTFQEPKETIKYSLAKDDQNNTIVTETRNVKGVFWERLELQNFPFDIQELSVTIASRHSNNEVKLISDPSKVSKLNYNASHTFIDQQKWRLFKLVNISNKASYDTENSSSLINKIRPVDEPIVETPHYPKIVASCFCARKAGYYIFNAFFLIFLITVTTFAIFGIDCKLSQNRIPATCTFLLTSVSFKWVINRSLPTVSYLTSLDKYSINCIFFICLMCAWHSVVGAHWEKDEARQIDKWVLIGFVVAFIIMNLCYLIYLGYSYMKVRKLANQEIEFLKKLNNNLNKTTSLSKI